VERGHIGAAVASIVTVGAVVSASVATSPQADQAPDATHRVTAAQQAGVPLAATVEFDDALRYPTESDGDLWPSCWSTDGHLYSAWGDGFGFDEPSPENRWVDIGVARLSGDGPDDLTGANLALAEDVGPIWTEGPYNRKPTGMVCVDDVLYLAVQDLRLNFNHAPAATIVRSTDNGETWSWDDSAPMFDDGVFTTIWFADYGQGGEHAPDRYVYAYGLDHNWRDSFDDSVPDPTDVYLARVPRDRVQDRSQWRFFTGQNPAGEPLWSRDIDDRAPVLHDDRRVYAQKFDYDAAQNMTVLSQGGVLYNEPLDAYVYGSWTEFTFELYSSPTPWGPWELLGSRDYGGYPWTPDKHGGYATTFPSKFLSDDGLTLHMQANVAPIAPAGIHLHAYRYNLREVKLQLPEADADNPVSDDDLADPSTGAVPISKSTNVGDLGVIVDGDRTVSEDDRDGEVKRESWWGVTWPRAYTLNRFVFTSGRVAEDGGWFLGRPTVQVRQDGEWVDVPGQLLADPPYPGDASAGGFQTYTYDFSTVLAEGIRLKGVPGGDRTWTSAAEVEAYRTSRLIDGGFEDQPAIWLTEPWRFEGRANYGIDVGGEHARSGDKNAWIRTVHPVGTNAITQDVDVVPGRTYTFSGWFRTGGPVPRVRLEARWDDGGEEAIFEDMDPEWVYEERSLTFTVPDGVDQVTLAAGYDAEGGDVTLQMDDLELTAED
jgi:hypothetical protein